MNYCIVSVVRTLHILNIYNYHPHLNNDLTSSEDTNVTDKETLGGYKRMRLNTQANSSKQITAFNYEL